MHKQRIRMKRNRGSDTDENSDPWLVILRLRVAFAPFAPNPKTIFPAGAVSLKIAPAPRLFILWEYYLCVRSVPSGNATAIAGDCNTYFNNHPNKSRFVASRDTTARLSTSGISFGQTSTQFCDLPQSCTPPSPMMDSSRSFLCIAPEGCRL